MKKTLLLCTHKVNRSNIRRESRDGVEHIIIRSFTLPPDIVMNDVAYLTEDRDKAVELFNRTPVTIEHPEINGQYVTASDPQTDMDFRFGAWNENAHITDDNRIALDKVINVQKALLVPQGKRLLDRLDEIEANSNARPLHTSIGVYVSIKDVEPTINSRGQKFSQIATDLWPDHDAILLDNVGASTPDQGTGIFPNLQRDNVRVMHYNCTSKDIKGDRKTAKREPNSINKKLADNKEDDAMRKAIEAKLKALGIKANAEASDDELLALYESESNKAHLLANKVEQPKQLSGEELSVLVSNAVKEENKPLHDKIGALETELKANKDKETDDLVALIVNSKKYDGLDSADIKLLPVDKIKDLAANCRTAHGLPSANLHLVDNEAEDEFKDVDLNAVGEE